MKILTIDLGRHTPPALHSVLRDLGTGYFVEQDATRALEHCRAGRCTVAVLCVDRSGPQEAAFCTDLRDGDSEVPLLVVAGRTASEDLVNALDSGADDYLPGDRPPAELAARVRALARREPQLTAGRVSHGALVLDLTAHRAWREGSELPLTALQLALLETLVRHSGHVLSRAQLVDLVWDPTQEPSSNVVDQAVAALRRAVGHDLIETVRGIGYRFAGS